MKRSTFLLGAAAMVLTACASAPSQSALGPDGKPLPRVYRIRAGDTGRIQFRMLDAINALRQASGAPALELNARLNAAAATHARDMSVQNRPWHFGSDGSSPITRIQRAGYSGKLVGEAISETYETELETLGAWMEAPNTRTVILDPSAREMGFSWYQESNGKIWWNLILGSPGETGFIPVNAPS
ncbi:divisome-associated lipoprotein DalA [Marivita geojedonensis]|uniref:Transmembrane protein n=1 Tax=Marivita geojedonensis TaxID=1123756 RepID=A0A1X4NJM4_9RHOB|nr:CAP domain-containing protein [Marivita geojedonensis]OSQ49879.1 transmembrane protein [Marivita geojedonensis]PRY76105.1 Cysteine-rich secretory protein family protein [Marivita geojedonensis]